MYAYKENQKKKLILLTLCCLSQKMKNLFFYMRDYLWEQGVDSLKDLISAMMLKPLLNRRTKSMVSDKAGVGKLVIGHWRSIVLTVQPRSYCLCFIRKTICSNMWILHHFLITDKENKLSLHYTISLQHSCNIVSYLENGTDEIRRSYPLLVTAEMKR